MWVLRSNQEQGFGGGSWSNGCRATSNLSSSRYCKKVSGSHLTWLTEKRSKPLLLENPLVDRTLHLDFSEMLKIEGEHFDAVFVMDKDQRVGGILNRIKARKIFGFQKAEKGLGIVPANPEAEELWSLGLNDEKKFFINQKPETQLLHEAFALGKWTRDPYILRFSDYEKTEALKRREGWLQGYHRLVGINTGCSALYPNKKLSVNLQRELIVKLQRMYPSVGVVLLGGPEDTERNQLIARGLDVISSPTEAGIRDGLISTSAVDVLVSGDSLGLHMGIALRKWCVAWFGPTCSQEIDLYDRGTKVITQASCHPCWKKVCHKDVMCYDLVNIHQIIDGVEQGLYHCESSSSKLHFLEI